jgi:hypothetical protein
VETYAKLRCRCGAVTGRVQRASPSTLNRVVCYCSDCQAFAHYLGRADLLDAQGGSDIVQAAPAAIEFQRGTEHIAALRLSEKGLYRFYVDCCKTPVGNLVGPAIPFIGIVAQAFEGDARSRDELVGRPTGAVHGQDAIGMPPPGSRRVRPRVMLRALRLVIGWRLTGQAWPHPFFDRGARVPKFPVKVISPAERDALRLLCGPRPAREVGLHA